MKYCVRCGQVLPEVAKFCPICGAEQVLETPINPQQQQVVKETPKEEPIEETRVIEEPIGETPVEETPIEEVPVEETRVGEERREETPKKGNKFIYFILKKDPIKMSIIFLGALFVISLIFWIISTQVRVLGIFKFLLPFVLSLATLARVTFFLVMEIIKNKFRDLYNFVIKSVFVTAHLFILILNFIFMWII